MSLSPDAALFIAALCMIGAAGALLFWSVVDDDDVPRQPPDGGTA